MPTADITDFVEKHLEYHEGFPHPDWLIIGDHLERNIPEDLWGDAMDEALDAWLDKLVESLGEEYFFYESDNFLLVTDETPEFSLRMLDYLEGVLFRIVTLVDGISDGGHYARHVVIMFVDASQYYSYISYFHPEEGEFGLSAGAF